MGFPKVSLRILLLVRRKVTSWDLPRILSFTHFHFVPHSKNSVIVAHTHYFPPEAARDPKSFAQKHKEPTGWNLFFPMVRPGIQSVGNPEDMLEEMDKASVDQVVVLGWYWENPETCRMQNEWNAQLVKEFPDRFIAFASYHADAQSPIDDLKWCLDKVFEGSLRHPGVREPILNPQKKNGKLAKPLPATMAGRQFPCDRTSRS